MQGEFLPKQNGPGVRRPLRQGSARGGERGKPTAAESDSMMKAVMRERGFDIGDERPAGIDSLKKNGVRHRRALRCLEGRCPRG
jgi:hypothetical protein